VTFDDTAAITLDVDWAPEAAIAAAADALERCAVKATFFATHPSEVLRSLNRTLFEVGLHPNFNEARTDLEQPLAALKDLYPQARGARSHSLFVSSHILGLYRRHGLRYEANVFLDGHPHLRPVIRFADLVSIPFNWSDDKHLERSRPFRVDALGLDRPGLKVFNFHPIHVFVNTSSEAHYAAYRSQYHDADALRAHIAPGPGIGTLFRDLIETLAQGVTTVATMGEIGELCLASA
jgi:polysaccharide deactylase WbmS-like protein